MMLVTERFAEEMLKAFKMAREGQRLYDEAYAEANNYDGDDGEHAPWQYRMDAAERTQEDADVRTSDIEARARAAGVDITEMLYLVTQHLHGSALGA
jgi:hypothetical protein